MIAWVGLALAGGLGAVARFVISRRLPVPYGTLGVNLSGSFVLGLISPNFVLGTGFIGAYTTFSTWMLESSQLSRRAAVLNLVGSLGLGLAAARLGVCLRHAG